MKTKLILVASFLLFIITSHAQQGNPLDKWAFLTGEWRGEGSGQPGQGSGTFSFSFDLDKNIIIRKSHSIYPATASKPEIIHDDLMIIYPDINANTTKAIYFDNEGHIINYSVTYTDNSIIMTSDKAVNVPVFRLTYTLPENGILNTKFEMSRDGENFMTYVEGKSKKINISGQ